MLDVVATLSLELGPVETHGIVVFDVQAPAVPIVAGKQVADIENIHVPDQGAPGDIPGPVYHVV
jgi:hypothetical protein